MTERMHWSLEFLASYLDDSLSQDDKEQLEAHVAYCRTCSEQLEWLTRVTQAAQADELVDPPPWVMQRALRLFNQVTVEDTPSLFEKIVARLVFDSRQGLVPAVRAGSSSEGHRLLYSAGELEIDLEVRPGDSGSHRTLIGQVMHRSGGRGQPGEVELARGRRRVVARRTTPSGEFAFARLRPGEYDIRIRVGRKQIEVPEVMV